MQHRARTWTLFAAACLVGANLMAADASFVGKWKVNVDKSAVSGVHETIEDLGNGQFKITSFGDEETYFLDGQEHPTRYHSVRTLSTEGPNHWKLLSKREGKVTGTEHWSISDDQTTLTIAAEGTRADGSSFKTETKAKRTAGKTGFAGTWEFTQFDPADFTEWVIEPFGDDGLDFVTPSAKEHDRVKLDGKDYPDEGPRVPAGMTTAVKRIDARTLEMTGKSKGKLVVTNHLELSEDGKTITIHITFPGEEKKMTVVLERE